MRNEDFFALAPLNLRNYRTLRYQGADMCVRLADFTEEDQERLRALYEYLGQLAQRLDPPAAGLVEFTRQRPPIEIVRLASQTGQTSYQQRPSPLMRQALHDLRGGGLTPLLGLLQLAPRTGLDAAAVRSLFYLTRDHRKIMRNAILGLDNVKREEDLLLRIHGTDLLVEKWKGTTLYEAGRALRMEVECAEVTQISECCVEFGSIDRILYNLVNNACRHAASDQLRLVMFRVPDTHGESLRLVLINTLRPEDLARLQGRNLAEFFELGASTTGSGCGLAIATDFVSHAYGVAREKALADGYLGAALQEDSFVAWFHWPRVMVDV